MEGMHTHSPLVTMACALAVGMAPPALAQSSRPDRSWRNAVAKPATGVAGLPHAFGHSFATLDAYLAHLRDHAASIDLPWYREVRPGVFAREGRGAAGPKEYTRAELERRWGFAR